MSKAILNDLTELVDAGIISRENAENIREFYVGRQDSSQNKLFVVFGLLGAILVGLGIILIIAHNWDDLSRKVKTGFAFLPLVTGQAICIYVLLKKSFSNTWREGSAAFLFLAVGASISLISQVYNIPGNISSFLFTWMLLTLPLVYIMNSGGASLMYILGISYFAIQTGYWSNWYNSSMFSEAYKYWFLLVLVLPFYYKMVTKNPTGNFTVFNNWFIVLSVLTALGTIARSTEEFMWLAYLAFFSIVYLLQFLPVFSIKRKAAEFYAIGSLGITGILLALSFDGFWIDIYRENILGEAKFLAREAIVSFVLLIIAAMLFLQKKKNFIDTDGFELIFIPFSLIFFIGMFNPQLAVILINLLVLALGILQIREGAKINHLGILNYGLLIITALVICRFFDIDLSFVIRGILFLTVGAGFFIVNYIMLKKRAK